MDEQNNRTAGFIDGIRAYGQALADAGFVVHDSDGLAIDVSEFTELLVELVDVTNRLVIQFLAE